jgi:hypothetical protein
MRSLERLCLSEAHVCAGPRGTVSTWNIKKEIRKEDCLTAFALLCQILHLQASVGG